MREGLTAKTFRYKDELLTFAEAHKLEANHAYLSEIKAYRESFSSFDDLHGAGPLARLSDPLEWLKETEDFALGRNLPDGYVPASQYILFRKHSENKHDELKTEAAEFEAGDKILAMLQLRHKLSDHLLKFGGHIGYSVHVDERQKGYGSLILELVLDEALDLGIDKLLVTCNSDNLASKKVILNNDGKYESSLQEDNGRTVERYWINL